MFCPELRDPIIFTAPSNTTSKHRVNTNRKKTCFKRSSTNDSKNIKNYEPHVSLNFDFKDDMIKMQRLNTIKTCMEQSRAQSTKSKYDYDIVKYVTPEEEISGMKLLPMTNQTQFLCLFASLDGKQWSVIRSVRSAISAWHKQRGLSSIMDEYWSVSMCEFWYGLKRRAIHTVQQKTGIALEQFLLFVDYHLSFDSLVHHRWCVIASICYFGLRRISEVLQLIVGDIRFIKHSYDIDILIQKQKNDQLKKGMMIRIPHIADLKSRSPSIIIRNWFRSNKFTTDDLNQTLFPNTVGKNIGMPVSYDNFRRVTTESFKHILNENHNISTHSFRRGFSELLASSNVKLSAIQRQGGWASRDVMCNLYARMNLNKVAEHITSAVVNKKIS